MNDDQFFLANAYLDGELNDAERAIAETDPEVMAAVDELRALQELVRDVDPPLDTVRRTAIAAAMAEFAGSAAASAGRPSAPAPIPFRPRPSYAKYLAVAAGVLGVGVLGVAIANLDTGSDDSVGMASEPAEQPAEEPAESRLAADADVFAEDAGDGQMEGDMASDQPTMALVEESAEEPAEEPADQPAEEPASGPDSDGAVRPVLVPGQVLTTPEELGSFGTELLEADRAGELTTPNAACPIENVLGRARYLDVDGSVLDVLVAVDEPAAIVLAFKDDTCEFLVTGPLYLD